MQYQRIHQCSIKHLHEGILIAEKNTTYLAYALCGEEGTSTSHTPSHPTHALAPAPLVTPLITIANMKCKISIPKVNTMAHGTIFVLL